MRLYILHNDEFAYKVTGHLVNSQQFCRSCDLSCTHCRSAYPSHADSIHGMEEAHEGLPELIDDPEIYLPVNPPYADILILVKIHPDLLSAAAILAERVKAKAVLVPIEEPQWCTRGLQNQVEEELNSINVESSFPKPFCAMKPGDDTPVINKFMEEMQVGWPELQVGVDRGVIRRTNVTASAPCGSTWYVAQQIKGIHADNRGELYEAVSMAHHAYPCTASMNKDTEIGDTILHRAGYIIREAVEKAVEENKLA